MFKVGTEEIERFIFDHGISPGNACRLRDWPSIRSAFFGVDLADLIYLIPRLAGTPANFWRSDAFRKVVDENEEMRNKLTDAFIAYDVAYRVAKGKKENTPEADAKEAAFAAYTKAIRDAETSDDATTLWLRKTYAFTVGASIYAPELQSAGDVAHDKEELKMHTDPETVRLEVKNDTI